MSRGRVWRFDAAVLAVAIAPSDDHVAIATRDGALHLEDAQPARVLSPRTRELRGVPAAVAWSDDGRWLAVGTNRGIEVFDEDEGARSHRWVEGRCFALRFASDGTLLIGDARGAETLDLVSGEVRRLVDTREPVLGFSAAGDRAVVSREETVCSESEYDAHGEVAAPRRVLGTRTVVEGLALPLHPGAARPSALGMTEATRLGLPLLALGDEVVLLPGCAASRDGAFVVHAVGQEARRVDLVPGRPGGPRAIDRRRPKRSVPPQRVREAPGPTRPPAPPPPPPPAAPPPKWTGAQACTRCAGSGDLCGEPRGGEMPGPCGDCGGTGSRAAQEAEHSLRRRAQAEAARARCGACAGTGTVQPEADPACPHCKGRGVCLGEPYERWDSQGETVVWRDSSTCPCRGESACGACGGTGRRA